MDLTDLQIVLQERAAAASPTAPDLDRLLSQGKARRRRRVTTAAFTGAAAIALAVTLPLLLATGTSRSGGTAVLLPAATMPAAASPPTLAALTCEPDSFGGWVATILPLGYKPAHSAAQAKSIATQVVPDRVGPVLVALAMVNDPVAVKVGLPRGPRPMWVVQQTSIAKPRPAGAIGGYVPPGTRSGPTTDLTYVDDATLTLAGKSTCSSKSGSS